MATTVTVRYFAWLRERIGQAEETIELPAEVTTPRSLMTWLAARGEPYRHAFERPDVVRAAINQRHASLDANLAGAREIAFFPPVTGG